MSQYTPNIFPPVPPGSTTPKVLALVPTVSTPTVLGAAGILMKGIQFRAEKAALTPNVGIVTLQTLTSAGVWADLQTMAAGDIWNWPSADESISAAKFRITTDTASDGVRVVYHQPF